MVKLKLNEELAIYMAVVIFQRLIFMNSFFFGELKSEDFFFKSDKFAYLCPFFVHDMFFYLVEIIFVFFYSFKIICIFYSVKILCIFVFV